VPGRQYCGVQAATSGGHRYLQCYNQIMRCQSGGYLPRLCFRKIRCVFERRADTSVLHMEQLTMTYDHLICIDEDAKEVVIYRVDSNGKRTLYTKAPLPEARGENSELESFARMLGENLLLDSPAARRLLDL
jgi:hypothetical protein